jgi:hypothetical protein
MELSTGLSIFLRPLIAFVVLLLIVKPIKMAFEKLTPDCKLKRLLLKRIN